MTTRQKKYPDTATFHFFNANPKGKYTGDCLIRALATALEQDYCETLMELAQISCKTGYSMGDNENITAYLKTKGWVKMKQPRKEDRRKFTGEEFCMMMQFGLLDAFEYGNQDLLDTTGIKVTDRLVANIGGGHIVAIVDGKVWDTWNSTDGCIGNYWCKA